MPMTLPAEVSRAVESYLGVADRLLPGAVIAAAVAGSVALGAYRPNRSDIDVVAVISDDWRDRRDLIVRLRLLHLSQLPRLALRAARGQGFSACCNVSFIWSSEVRLPVSRITPIASHTGELFNAGRAFDVNPVIWKELVSGGIVVRSCGTGASGTGKVHRGHEIAEWGLDPEPKALRPWVRANLRGYWTPLVEQLRTGRRRLSAGRVAWCLLGPARMHCTLATGEIISKEAAAAHLLETFPVHSPLAEVALASVQGARLPADPPRERWRRLTASAMEDILAEAVRTNSES